MKKFIVLTIALLLLLSACGAGTQKFETDTNYDNYTEEYSYKSDSEYSAGGGIVNGAPMSPEYSTAEAPAPTVEIQIARKLIKNASLTIESKEFDAAIAAAEQLCADFGGYIENSSIYGGDSTYSGYYSYSNQRSASYMLRIPEKSYDAFLQKAGNIGNVTYKSQSAQDVTDAYYDTASRLAAAETRRDRLMALLEKADTMETIIQLERALSDTIYEIDSYSGTLKLYDNQVNYSYISINLTEVIEFTPEGTPPPITLGERVKDAGSEAWRGLVDGAQAALIWVIRNIFTLVILAAIAVIAIVLARRANQKKAKNANNKSKNDELK